MDSKRDKGCLCEELAGPGMVLSRACLGGLWLFENLSSEEGSALMTAAFQKRYEVGETIFRQGQEAGMMFLLKGGRVKLTKLTRNGGELTVDILKPGDSLGENLLNQETVFPFTATCLKQSVTCGLTRAAFEMLVLEHPNIGLQVIKTLSSRIDRLTARVGGMALTSLEDRLLKTLRLMAREHGTRDGERLVLSFPLTHEDLGFLVGAHRVSITRALKGLRNSGRLLGKGKTYILKDERL